MDTECSPRPPSRSSHTSTPLEQDMVILRSVSPSIRPGTLFPEQNTGSNPHEDVSHDADVGLQQHLLGFERAEEKLMLLHHQRHEQVMGVQEQMLIEMREMKKILKNTNQHICQHNQFMASISETLIKLHDQRCAATPATTSTATLFPTVEYHCFPIVSNGCATPAKCCKHAPPQTKVTCDMETSSGVQIPSCEDKEAENSDSNVPVDMEFACNGFL